MENKMIAEQKLRLKRHRADYWIDVIQIEAPGGPLLRLVCKERWKTSGLSGDEWRFSYHWQCNTSRGGAAVWEPIERAHSHRPSDAALLLYEVVERGTHQKTPVTVHLYRKGHLLWTVPEIRPLRDAAGHLPWDMIIAGEQHDAIRAEEATKHLCCQPGCRAEPVVTYRIITQYDDCGNARDADWVRTCGEAKRHFCQRHRHRGDCALEDADVNYEVIQ